MELQVEKANTVQLYGILEELSNTTYFRLFQINLDGKCKFWAKNVSEAKCNSSTEPEPFTFGPPKPKTQCSLDMTGSASGKKKSAAQSAPPVGFFGGFPMPTTVSLISKSITSQLKTMTNFSAPTCANPTS
jgi:hypothetical protein